MPTTLPALCKCDDHARISNFDRVSPLSFDRYETGADSRLCPASILPLTRSVLPAQQVRVVRPSIVVAWRKNIRLETPSVSTRAAVFFFPSSVRSTLDARLRSILLVVLDRATVVDGARVLFPLSSSECVQFAVSDPQICIGFTGSSLVFTREKR